MARRLLGCQMKGGILLSGLGGSTLLTEEVVSGIERHINRIQVVWVYLVINLHLQHFYLIQ